MVHKFRTIFFGTPAFAVPALKALVENKRFDVVAVVSQPDRPAGRKKIVTPPPVKVFAEERGIKVIQPEKLKDEAIDRIKELAPELAVVVAYGNLIPKALIEAAPKGFVNIHPSLLPKHRGASPITAAILDGDKETGVCLMVLDDGMDHGPVIACRKVALSGDETTESLLKSLAPVGAQMIDKELAEYLDGKLVAVPQDHDKATFCKLIEADDARIDWAKTAVEIERLVRAMDGVTPAWTTLDGKTLLVRRGRASDEKNDQTPGTLIEIKNNLAVATGEGCLFLDELQLSGGKAMSGQAFLNGHKDLMGKVLV
jgi:methionyl-tRNA formyltransferase